MRDIDSEVLAANPTATTCLAAYLNAAMAKDASARARYLAIYGVEWAPLGDGTEWSETRSAASEAVTVCAKGTR